MRINHNLSALNTYSRLNSANLEKAKSLEKLSSGMRINRAGDDAAGLAISEKMRSQIRGLNQASRNTQDGISMIQTAEGALNETASILQRMRELAVQAANDTYNDQDRKEIQNEIDQLSSEVNRIAGSTEFNKQTLLNGEFSETSVNGASISIEKTGANVTQAVFEVEITSITNGTNFCFQIANNTAGGSINVNCIKVCYSGAISNGVARIAAGLNSCEDLTTAWNVEARGNKLIFTSNRAANSTASNIAINACTTIFAANGCSTISICTAVQTQEAACATVNKTYLTLDDEIMQEGVMITVGEKSAVFFNSSCGNYESETDMREKLNLATDVNIIDLYASNSDTVDEVLACLQGLCVQANNAISVDTSNNRICVISANTGVGTAGSQYNKYSNIKVVGVTGTSSTSGNGKMLQIGANSDQQFKVHFGDMTGKGINVTSDAFANTLETSNGQTAYFNSNSGVTDLCGNVTEYALDVRTAEKATAAISALDDAIVEVSAQRSKLGAYQNRLEHTIENLNTSEENLTAAESRIRDVDMAKEMMEFTKNNILNQAATAMLAQANQQPQSVLQLLK